MTRKLLLTTIASTALSCLSPSKAEASDPFLCVLWAREYARIEVVTATDLELVNATPRTIEQMAIRLFYKCLNMETDRPPLPDVTARKLENWSISIAKLTVAKQGTTPAGEDPSPPTPNDELGMSGFSKGSEEWLNWCREEYNTWREDDQTVVRYNSRGKRVPCPG